MASRTNRRKRNPVVWFGDALLDLSGWNPAVTPLGVVNDVDGKVTASGQDTSGYGPDKCPSAAQ